MVRHWLGCPPNGYLGLRYGSDVKSLLQTPMAAGLADGLIAKAREDVPLLQAMDGDAVNVYAYDKAMDHKAIAFEINGQFIEASGQGFSGLGGDMALVDGQDRVLVNGLSDLGIEKLHKHVNFTLPSTNYF